MKFSPTILEGAYVVELEPHRDHRGFFARTWCRDEFERRGLDSQLVQTSISYNARRGTLRGMHYQLGDAAEVKLVRCVKGALWDAILDLRPGSASFTPRPAGIS